MIAMNSTSVRIRFTLPQILVGLIGHAELHFTSNPLVPSYEWNVQKFARPNRLFDTPNIEYHLMNLKPETTYYFQIRVIVEALQSGPESEIYKLKMPATGSKNGMNAASGVTSTTTSTLPPLVMIDVHLNAVVDDSDGPGSGTSVTVTWRPLDRRERKLIDGIQIKYRKIDEPESAASVTPIIHRDLTSYKLKNLDPGSSYLLDLLFKTEEDIASNVVSSKPIVIELPAAGRGDQQPAAHSPVSLLIDPLTDVFVEAHKASFRLRSLPKPIDKFVAVVKISYRNTDGDQEQAPAGLMHMFRAPDEQVALDGLKPRRKYKVWIDCYLISGKMLSSNAIDVMTKEEDGAKSGDGAINHSQDESQDAMNEALASESTKSTSTGTHQHSLKSDELRPYYIALTIMALFAAVTSIAFLSLLCVILRSKSSAKAPITRSLSDQAYDNPTYKACDNERTGSNAANDHNHHHNNLNHRNHDPHHLPQQIKLNGMNGATIIGTAQV